MLIEISLEITFLIRAHHPNEPGSQPSGYYGRRGGGERWWENEFQLPAQLSIEISIAEANKNQWKTFIFHFTRSEYGFELFFISFFRFSACHRSPVARARDPESRSFGDDGLLWDDEDRVVSKNGGIVTYWFSWRPDIAACPFNSPSSNLSFVTNLGEWACLCIFAYSAETLEFHNAWLEPSGRGNGNKDDSCSQKSYGLLSSVPSGRLCSLAVIWLFILSMQMELSRCLESFTIGHFNGNCYF